MLLMKSYVLKTVKLYIHRVDYLKELRDLM